MALPRVSQDPGWLSAGPSGRLRYNPRSMGFFRGFLAPFRGAVFVARARMWHLVILPILLNVGLAVGASWAAARYWKVEFAGRVFSSSFVYVVSLSAVVLLTSIVAFILLQPLLGAVFNDILTEQTERKIRADAPRAPFLASVGRSLAHGFLKLILYAFALLVERSCRWSPPGLAAWSAWPWRRCSSLTTGSTIPWRGDRWVFGRNGAI